MDELSNALNTQQVQSLMKDFEREHSDNPNFKLWSSYMSMVEILLDFIRAEREGNWNLHLEAFAAMLPWLIIYDHTNYAKWGPVYLAEMKNLENTAPEVYAEFTNGNFVVKRSKRRFNQVPADQATEWIYKTCKMQNGIIGITRNDQARDRFCVTWSERSQISEDTRHLFGLEDDEEESSFTRFDSLASRRVQDADDVAKLFQQLNKYDVFRVHAALLDPAFAEDDGVAIDIPLVLLATKDIAPSDVVSDLLTAEDRGKQHLVSNVQQRLIDGSVRFHDSIKKNFSKTFGDLYKTTVSTKQHEMKSVKADRKLIQRLLNAVTAGRPVEMDSIMKHELSTVPLSIAKVGGNLHSTSKAELIDILKGQINIPSDLPETDMKTCVLIDGHALIKALGKPNGCQTFGEYADAFFNVVRCYFDRNICLCLIPDGTCTLSGPKKSRTARIHKQSSRVDVVFDRYIGEDSIKASTRAKRIGKTKPIRKVIDGPHVPLPHVWSNFISMDENKSDIANFLSEMIMQKGENLPERWELVTGGGFSSPTDARSTRRQTVHLHGNHEQADTRLILHSCEAASEGYERLVLRCSDTCSGAIIILYAYESG